MKRPHVCFISQEYPPDTGWGGIGAYTYEMAHGLARAGHQISVISRAVDCPGTTTDAGIRVYRTLPSPEWHRFPGAWRLNGYWPGFAWSAMLCLRSILATSRVDVVEAGEGRADSFFVSHIPSRIPVVVRLHTARIFVDRLNRVAPDRKQRFTYWLEKRCILRADALTAPSHAMAEMTRTWITPHHDVAVVPNPVDIGGFSPSSARGRPEVLFVGRLERRKGIETLAAALPEVLCRVPGSSFRFVGADGGDGDGRSWRERILDRVPDSQKSRVVFEQVLREEMPERYRRASVCVVPSLWENFPYAALEALASGVPVVATQSGGLPEIIEHGKNGLLVPVNDSGALAGAVSLLLTDERLRSSMAHEARDTVARRFATERIVPDMIDIYRRVCRAR